MSIAAEPKASPAIRAIPNVGVRIAGSGLAVPDGTLTNFDLEQLMETSDEWIRQRTGITERRLADPLKGEDVVHLATRALERALADARMDAGELELVILASVTGGMTCPASSCRVINNIGANGAAAFDVLAACSGFVYGLNIANDMIRAGSFTRVAVIGCDVMSSVMDYENRPVAILFGDAAGAAVLRATDDTSRGMLAASMHADGSKWHDLYLPSNSSHLPEGADLSAVKMNSLQMNGREVYKFAVGTFSKVIEQTLEKAGMQADDVDMYVCHQSNARMLESARKRFNLPEEKFYVNIDRFGNCSAGSVPVALQELRDAGKCQEGDVVMFVAFGGGLTWAANLWRL